MLRCTVQRSSTYFLCSSSVVLRPAAGAATTPRCDGELLLLWASSSTTAGESSSPATFFTGRRRRVAEHRRWFSSSASPNKIVIPPNLSIDPRSSFAPQQRQQSAVLEDTVEEEEEEEDDLMDAEQYLPTEDVVYATPLPDRLKVNIHNLFSGGRGGAAAGVVGTIWLEETVFGKDPIRVDLLKRAVDYHRARKRGRRKAKTKTIGEVSGSGRKVRPQKGTGRARMGHSRPPHHRGGAKAHGPKNTVDYGNTKLNKKVRKAALRHALSQKLKEGNLMLLDQLYELPTHKTRDLEHLLRPHGIAGKDGESALLLDHYTDEDAGQHAATSYAGVPINLWVASSNLPKLTVGNDKAAVVYDILKHDKLLLTLAALEQIEGRLKE